MRAITALGLVVLTTWVAGCNPSAPASSNAEFTTATPASTVARPERPEVGATTVTRADEPARPVDFKLTVEDLSKELKRGGRSAKAKYEGKRVELSGKVLSLSASGSLGFAMFGNPEDDLPTNITLRKSDQNKFQGLRALSRTQDVTVRGQLAISFGIRVEDAELVTVGPSPARVVTVAELAEDFARPDKDKKLIGSREVVVRAEVRANEKSEYDTRLFSISDPGKDAPQIKALLGVAGPDASTWADLKPGTVLILIGEASSKRMQDVRVLSAPPEGVKLPDTR